MVLTDDNKSIDDALDALAGLTHAYVFRRPRHGLNSAVSIHRS